MLTKAEKDTYRLYLIQIWEHKYIVLCVTLLVALISSIMSMPFMKRPEYKSEAITVLPNIKNAKSLTFLKSDFKGYGIAEPHELRQIVAVLESEAAFKHMVEKFDLIKHYRLNNIKSKHTLEKQLYRTYKEKVKFDVIKKATVKILVYDVSPDTAALMVNEFIDYAHQYIEKAIKRNLGLQALRESIDKLQAERDMYEDSASFYRNKYDLYRIDHLGEVVSNKIYNSFTESEFAIKYDKLISFENRVRDIETYLAQLRSEYSHRKDNLRVFPTLLSNAAIGIQTKYISRPNNLLIISVCTFVGFLFAISVVIFVNNFPFEFNNVQSNHQNES